MLILYFDWDEFNNTDCQDALLRLGHTVDRLRLNLKGYELTPEIEQELKKLFEAEHYDLVFSFDYFPGISQACQKYGVPYVSWVFDCPHYTLDSHTINNPVNNIYVFDRLLCERLKNKGVTTVGHSPLGVNVQRLSEVCRASDEETAGRIVYLHDVCFLGNLYDNEFNYYDQVDCIPEDLRQRIDAVINKSEEEFGKDLFTDENEIPEDDIRRLGESIRFEKTGRYDIDYDIVLRDILRKKVTVNERRQILEEMAKHFDTVMYTTPDAKPVAGVKNLGLAEYHTKMPLVFRRSKINLNIGLRCILSGISLRVLDVLAAGGFLLTTYTKEIDEYFEDGKELVIARTPKEMIEKAAYYLEHEDERKEIAINGQKKVFEEFAYTKLLPRILSVNN